MLGAVCLCVKLNTLGIVAGVWGVAALFLVSGKGYLLLSVAPAHSSGLPPRYSCLEAGFIGELLISGYPLFPSRMISRPGCVEGEGERRGSVP